MEENVYLKIHEKYRSHLKWKMGRRYCTSYQQLKLGSVYSFLRYIYTSDYPLTETLNEYLPGFKKITEEEYSEEYSRKRIRQVKEFIEWYTQYIETLFYHQEFIGNGFER